MVNFHSQSQFIRGNNKFLQNTGMEEIDEVLVILPARESTKSPGWPTAVIHSSDAARRGVWVAGSYDALMYCTLSG